jgi:thermostable 8-oxoguanine DNA glycosylase
MDSTVDPINIPKTLTRHQLEDWILFGICVANKEATQTRNKLDALLKDLGRHASPFDRVRSAMVKGTLMATLTKHRVGQYGRIYKAFTQVVELDLDNISVASLESVHGIGPKTARMTLLYYLPDAEVVPLDTHILKYLRKLGYEDAPKATPPSGKTYEKWEAIFVAEAKKAGATVREFDTYVWRMYAKSQNGSMGTRG